jgi:N-hydroxyarylamine O-acetyltransferase
VAEAALLDAYFGRIGHAAPARADWDTLTQLVLAHTRSIAFENLNPALGWPVLLDEAGLQEKIIGQQRGGFCYEQNLLFMCVLRALGFEVTGLSARVLWNAPPGMVRPRTHMLLLVRQGGEQRIADVGFGGQMLTGALALEPGLEQPTPHEPFRLLREDGGYLMQSLVAGEWRSLYSFDLQPQLVPDYEMACWYLCHHPQSNFVLNLIAARSEPGKRHALLNNQLTTHHLGGPSERRLVQSAAELRAVLEDTFLLRVPQGPEVEKLLARVAG